MCMCTLTFKESPTVQCRLIKALKLRAGCSMPLELKMSTHFSTMISRNAEFL